MKKTLIKAMVAGTLFASMLSFVGCGSRTKVAGKKEKDHIDALKIYSSNGATLTAASTSIERDNEVAKMFNSLGIKMVNIPGKNFKMLNTEVTQKLYTSIMWGMGRNPSEFEGDNNPVESVSWYDAIYFCNKLSEKFGFTPVYRVNGKTDRSKWNYTPHNLNYIIGEVTQNTNANGFRLPTIEEWQYAAKGGQSYTYSGSNNLDEVGWYSSNSGNRTYPVAQKKANGYGLYDMSGNVWEWCWDVDPDSRFSRYRCGGSCYNDDIYCDVDGSYLFFAQCQEDNLGFRIVCSADN